MKALLLSLLLLLPLLALGAINVAAEAAAAPPNEKPAPSNAKSSNSTQPAAAYNATVTLPYSSRVRFYSTDGRLLFAYASTSASDESSRRDAAFICSYAGSRRRRSNITYSLSVLYPTDAGAASAVDIQGRLARLGSPSGEAAKRSSRFVIGCSVSYLTSRRLVTEWNLVIIDPQAKGSGSSGWSDSAWLTQELLSLSSIKSSPIKSENNTVTCQVAMSPSRMEFARLSLMQNSRQLGLAMTDLQFSWDAEGQLTQRVDTTYLPGEDTAVDWFRCDATDPLRLGTVSKSLQVAYKAGLRRLHMFKPSTGETLTSESVVTKDDTISCQADVAMPEVTYSWQMMRSGRLTVVKGQNISLFNANLYYTVCCMGENELNGQKYKSKTCKNFRGNSSFNTANFFDKDGKREQSLTCGQRSTMGIVQVRYSEIACNFKVFQAGDNSSEVECATQKCVSDTALAQVRRNCKKRDYGCLLDATWLMDPFMKNALKSKDALPGDCFAWDGGLVRIEVDYFCTSPKFVQFNATSVGRRGEIVRYHLPRSGCYEIVARGASGGNHSTTYGPSGAGRWNGGKGAEKRGKFALRRGLTLSFVIGQHGGNSSEVSPTHRPSVEDNAGTGGGGATFVYSGLQRLYLAAGGGGGASYGLEGVPGQAGSNGSDSVGPNSGHRGRGGAMGSAGWTNTDAASYHGGVGAGWLSTGSRRAGPEHGGPGHGPESPEGAFLGGASGGMNPGAVGGFGGGGGGSEDNGASGGGGGYSGGGAGTHDKQAGGGGGSFCNETLAAPDSCDGVTGGNPLVQGQVTLYYLGNAC